MVEFCCQKAFLDIKTFGDFVKGFPACEAAARGLERNLREVTQQPAGEQVQEDNLKFTAAHPHQLFSLCTSEAPF